MDDDVPGRADRARGWSRTGGLGRAGVPAIGVLCLETRFTKIAGHIRNAATFDFPVVCRVVRGATPDRLVRQADPSLLAPFLTAARELELSGVAAITSGCGFLALFQRELADAVGVPLYSSSLIQLPMVHRMLRADQTVGLIVASQESLTSAHLTAVGAESVPVCVAGMAGQPEFREVILEGLRTDLDVSRLRGEVLAQAEQLARANPDMGAIVLECTDLVPFACAIQAVTNVPVFDIVTLTTMVHDSLGRQPYLPRARPSRTSLPQAASRRRRPRVGTPLTETMILRSRSAG